MKKLYLSPSDQTDTAFIGSTEKKEMEAIAARVKKLLASYVCDVVMPTVAFADRPKESKNKGCDFHLAIHSNGGTGTSSGAVGFFQPGSLESKNLMTAMVQELDKISPIPSNRSGNVKDGIAELPRGNNWEIRAPMSNGIPSAIIEISFHDNPRLAQWMINDKDNIAQAIVKSIVSTFNLTKPIVPLVPICGC